MNQTLPSGPTVVSDIVRPNPPVTKYVTEPDGVIRPMSLPSANHKLPSAPTVIPVGMPPPPDGSGYSVTAPASVTCPILLVPSSVNQAEWSGVTAIPIGSLEVVGVGYSTSPFPELAVYAVSRIALRCWMPVRLDSVTARVPALPGHGTTRARRTVPLAFTIFTCRT